ncbi:hypothetical protein PTTG_08106, partial [Puccinia triticina 1-1 BBBD Race 1]
MQLPPRRQAPPLAIILPKQINTNRTPLRLNNHSLDLLLPGTIPSGCSIHHPRDQIAKRSADTASDNVFADTGRKKCVRPNQASARWARYRAKAELLFVLPTEDDKNPQDPENAKQAIAAASGSKATFYYFVPSTRQHNPNPSKLLTSQATLKASYRGLLFGTCVIAPRGGPGFCKFQTIPFSEMLPDQLQGWEKLVCFFLDQTNYVAPVKNNGPLMGDEAAAYWEANEWIATHLQELAPRAFKEYRETLIKGNLPSMAHMEYPTPYNMFDFASFFTFTMHNFFNGPHQDTNANTWTLVCWIPIFNPKNSNPDDPILADDSFDM